MTLKSYQDFRLDFYISIKNKFFIVKFIDLNQSQKKAKMDRKLRSIFAFGGLNIF